MSSTQAMIEDSAAQFNHAIRSHIVENEKLHQPIIKQKDLQFVGDFIYARCLEEPDLIPAFEHEFSTYGYKFIWLKDDFKPFDTFMVAIITPYGMVTLYTKPEAFESTAREIDSNRDLFDRHQKAEAAGDAVEIEAVKKEFARRLSRKQTLYFLLSPIQALLLGIRGFLRLFKR